jgi:two-component system invasion response regulator UvrY
MIRVLIADDHEIVREGLKAFIARTGGMEVCAEASDAREALRLAHEEDCDVAVVDLNFDRGDSGLELLKDFGREHPDLPVIVYSMHPEEQYALRVLKAGASGYLTKGSPLKQMVEAIRTVARGGRYITPSVADIMADSIRADGSSAPHLKLSNREFEVMTMIASEKTFKEIAAQLGRSEKTVRTYWDRIRDKLHVEKPRDVRSYAKEHGLIR